MQRFLIPCLLIACLSSAPFFAAAQTHTAVYQRVEIAMAGREMRELAALGIDADHGVYRKGRTYTTVMTEAEVQKLRRAGWQLKVEVADLESAFIQESKEQAAKLGSRSGGPCLPGIATGEKFADPIYYTPGSVNGFMTYAEMMNALDEMLLRYPNLISERKPLGFYKTEEGRQLYWVQISDNPELQEIDEPEILYTGLHHAREPISATQMIWYMWYLLEQYSKNPEIKYLVDHSGIYFIPCVNPDGVLQNEAASSGGGGLWRKNKRDNGAGIFGVDLNRNYDLGWGFDNFGSSNNPADITYRGPFAASEPEVQAMRNFCEEHDFRIALNYHSFGNYLLYPWGYLNQQTEDSLIYRTLAGAFVAGTPFTAGLSEELLEYPINGTSDDWMYGENISKNKTYAFTPEVGDANDDFWPATSRIIPLNKQCMPVNVNALRALHNYGKLEFEQIPIIVDELDQQLDFRLHKIGLKAGSFNISLESPDSFVVVPSNPQAVFLTTGQQYEGSFLYTLKPPFSYGDTVTFYVHLNNGSLIHTDTLRRRISDVHTYFDPATTNSAWSLNGNKLWQTTEQVYYSAPLSFTDSPEGPYNGNSVTTMTMLQSYDLSTCTEASLSFKARWEIESGFDYAQVLASADGVNFAPLCGKYSTLGLETQDEGKPIYDGIRKDWLAEEIDLTDYVGGPVYIQFKMVADAIEELDGIYVDDIYINRISDKLLGSEEIVPAAFLFSHSPNPASSVLNIQVNQVLPAGSRILISSISGQQIDSRPCPAGAGDIQVDVSALPAGLYFYRLQSPQGQIGEAGKFQVLHTAR